MFDIEMVGAMPADMHHEADQGDGLPFYELCSASSARWAPIWHTSLLS